MKNRFLAAFIAALAAVTGARADSIHPTFDITGLWSANEGGTVSYFQEGTDVKFLFVGDEASDAHTFEGRYIGATRIEGIQHRRDPSGCTNELQLTITVVSATELSVSNKVLTGGCGLNKGDVFATGDMRS